MSLVNVANAEWIGADPLEGAGVWTELFTVTVNGNGNGNGNGNSRTLVISNAAAGVTLVASNPKDVNFTVSLSNESGDWSNSDYYKFVRSNPSDPNNGQINLGGNTFNWSASNSGLPNPVYLDASDVQGILSSVYVAASGYNGNAPVSFTLYAGRYIAPTPIDPDPVTPEPASMLIFGLGLAGLGLCRRMRKI